MYNTNNYVKYKWSTNRSETSWCVYKSQPLPESPCKAELSWLFLGFWMRENSRVLSENLPSSELWRGVAAHLHLKGHTQKRSVFAHTPKGANLTSYNK